jgi:pyocin large subunit-like protein
MILEVELLTDAIMKVVRHIVVAGAAILALAMLAGCDSGASAVKAPKGGDRADTGTASGATAATETGGGERGRRSDPRDTPVKLVAGKPYWAANRTRSAEENAQRSFERNGATFGARSTEDYVAKVHAFVSDPPKGTQSLKRSNGDVLIYDPKGNVFAVVSREGAPRTMFKPDEGASYWDTQKDRESKRASAGKKRDEAEG